jgi:Kef-type K+ transport system membrane component KefB
MRRSVVVYATTIGLSILVVAAILRGGGLMLPEAPATLADGADAASPLAQMIENASHPLARLLVQLLVIVGAARVCARLARPLGQPPVIGEIAAGIIIGPSLLGAVAPAVSATLFPADSLAVLQMLSQIGVLLFMFVIGVELDASHIRGRTRTAIAVSHFSIAVPFVLGVLLALLLYRGSAPIGVPFHAFALFLGVAMSITAFPVLARILEERQLTATPLGTTALTCAAVGDATAWTLLAFVSAVTTSGSVAATLLTMVGLSVAFILLAVYVVRPSLVRLLDSTRRADALSREHIALVLGVALLSALTTEVIGIHALFGAFLAGVVMPADATFRRLLRERLETITSVVLMPLFFAFTGLRTEIGLLNDPSDWITCLAIIVVATVGKMGGTIVAARWTGLAWYESVALGALMNTRGLMELIALNVGYDLGILTPKVFTMMVLMALVTTAMTGPLLSLVERRQHAAVVG